jgi:hypothetical protein
VKEYLFWFDMPGEHIAGIVVAAGASAIRADFAAADQITEEVGIYCAVELDPLSRCPLHRKRESQHHVNGCKTSCSHLQHPIISYFFGS